MKTKKTIYLIMSMFAVPVILASAQEKSNSDQGFAVLELFTSQGCSSCPPADEVVGKYALAEDPNIIALAFHVDYWNYIGWKDPFSNKKFTDRQHLYAENITSSVYTPQLIINGKQGLVGSDEKKIASLVRNELKLKSSQNIAITEAIRRDGRITVKYNTTAKDGYLNAALVRKKETTNVKRGENSGRSLTNYNIVTEFTGEQLHSKKTGEISFIFDAGISPSLYQVVVYIQEREGGKVVAAAKSNIK